MEKLKKEIMESAKGYNRFLTNEFLAQFLSLRKLLCFVHPDDRDYFKAKIDSL